MVLGLRSKSRKNVAIPVDYQIHIQEIKPWVISQSHKSDISIVFLQWEYGDQPPGSITSEAKDGKIEFTESFRLPITLIREAAKKKKGAVRESYQKNVVEFFLYEPRKDKPNKGQLLGTAVINFADYGVIRDTMTVSAPLSCKKSSKNLGQPVLYVKIQALGNEDVEIAAFSDDEVDDDDDTSSRSSRTTTSSTTRSAKIGLETSRDRAERSFREPNRAPRPEPISRGSSPLSKTSSLSIGSSPHYSPIRYSFHHPRSPTIDIAAFPSVSPDNSMPTLKKSATHTVRSPSSSFTYQHYQKRAADRSGQTPDYIQESKSVNVVPNAASSSKYIQESNTGSQVTQEDDGKNLRQSQNEPAQAAAQLSRSRHSPSQDRWNRVRRESGWKDSLVKKEYPFDAEAGRMSPDYSLDDASSYSPIDLGIHRGFLKNNKLTHAKSALITSGASKSNGVLVNNELVAKDIVKTVNVGQGKTTESNTNKSELLSQIEMLKEELREAAAVEVGLYSVVAEHGSSANKMHAPARRISRFYFHACKSGSKIKKENAARTAISGFILVSKACGNDVPRLTFWLSNSIMLRTIVSQTMRKPKSSGGPSKSIGKLLGEKFDSLDEPQKFMDALEKFESWIFSRIVESVWWQTMTPHMQPAAAKLSSLKKASGKKSGFGDNEQGNLSIELWKKAFTDACQRLCPSRAGGHECGCLPVLSCLVMEQLVSRLDVAMFNAILREDGEEMPTDPVSDPISDSKVLPIAAGRSSFGAGVQLKNAIGSWSRCLTDIFDIDDGSDDNNGVNNDEAKESQVQPFKPFRLLNSLSDLMMVPFEMLADKSTRKEVCPSLSATLIKMILYNFVPDEFCPTPIPEEVFAALESEEDSDANEGYITNFPFPANPTVYSPPSGTSLKAIAGELGSQSLQRGGSSVLRKSYTSDDELDELDSPMTSIVNDNSVGKRKSDRKVVRYELLREVWKDSE